MSLLTWRRAAMAMGVCAAWLAWQNAGLRRQVGDRRGAARADELAEPGAAGQGALATALQPAARIAGSTGGEAESDHGEEAPPAPRRHWALELVRLREGEDLLAYRDRVLPIAQAVVAPQRVRVGHQRQAMEARARLDARQQQELDAAVMDASDAIVNRVWQAVADQELWPRPRPAAGVALAADLLTSVTAADRRFRATLRDDQRAALDESGFDVADYLLFSVPWEERFGIAGEATP